MKSLFIIISMFIYINLFGCIKDTTRYKLNIKETSRILEAINRHIKYDEIYELSYYMLDTLHLAIDRTIYECNPAYAVDLLEKTRKAIKNNDYKYKLKIEQDDDSSTYSYIYVGYNKHIVNGYTTYDKYEVTLQFTEYNRKIIFIAIILSPMD